MAHFICQTCGTQFGETAVPPEHCPICEDERQYVGWDGQQWTTLTALQEKHQNEMREVEPHLTGISATPSFAIGQRALLLQTAQGNLLWDCVSLLDEATKSSVAALGGIQAIAISHPHFFSAMVEWSRAFDAPIYLHEANQKWVMRPDPAIQYWRGETKTLWDGLTLIRGGGHFSGSSMLHWSGGAGGAGVLLTGDTLQVAADRRYVSFMYSYPNMIPLSAKAVERIVTAVTPYTFERIYGAWRGLVVQRDGKTAVARSADRYIAALSK